MKNQFVKIKWIILISGFTFLASCSTLKCKPTFLMSLEKDKEIENEYHLKNLVIGFKCIW